MRSRVALLCLCLVSLWVAPAEADDGPTVGAGGDFFHVESSAASGGHTVSPAAASSSSYQVVTETVCEMGGQFVCDGPKLCDDGSVMTMTHLVYEDGSESPTWFSCPSDAAATAPPQVTPGMVLRAFRRIPLPASEVVVQPPGGRTLVNFDTNFYTEQGEFTRVVRLLGQRVELRIWPDTFTWRYGDGASEQTSSAGSAYPDLEITHRYLSKGRVAVSVDTTYAADFRVGNGAWQHVDGTVTIPGQAEPLRVVTATRSPFATKASAIARPMPRLPPVTSTDLGS